MKKVFFAVAAAALLAGLVTCDMFNSPGKNKHGSELDEWPSGLPEEEEIRYDENGNPMHKIGMVIGGGENGRALDQDIAMACINYFEVVIYVRDTNDQTPGKKYANYVNPETGERGSFYRAAGYYPILNTDNSKQPRNILWMWIPADLVVAVGYGESALCFGGYRRKRDTANEVMDYGKPEGFDLTMLAIGHIGAIYYNQPPYPMVQWVDRNSPITGNDMFVTSQVWQIQFIMHALEIDGRAAASAATAGGSTWDNFVAAAGDAEYGDHGVHGAFMIRGPVASTNTALNHGVDYSTVTGGNSREYESVGGKMVPYFELPSGNSFALDYNAGDYGHPDLWQPGNAGDSWQHGIVAQAFVRGIFGEPAYYTAIGLNEIFRSMISNLYLVSNHPSILTTNSSIVDGYACINDNEFNNNRWSNPGNWNWTWQGRGFPIYIGTGAKGWAMISIDIPIKACGNNPEGDIWYVRNGMYLHLPDTGYSQDSLGGGILIRVCDPGDIWTPPPERALVPNGDGTYRYEGIPAEYLPKSGP